MIRTAVGASLLALVAVGCGSDGGSPIPAEYPTLAGEGGHAVVSDVDVTSETGFFYNLAGSWTLSLHSADDSVGFSLLGVPSLRVRGAHTGLDPLIEVTLRDPSFDGSTGDCEIRDDVYSGGGGTITIDGATSAYVWGTVNAVLCSSTGSNPEATRSLNVKFSARIERNDADPEANGPGCKGTPQSCGAQEFDFTCNDLVGCYWHAGSCSGSPPLCSTLSNGNCWKIDGCYSGTGDNCSGVATPCSLLSGEFTCGVNQGCTWTPPDCTGVAESCAVYSEEWECAVTEGCVWNAD